MHQKCKNLWDTRKVNRLKSQITEILVTFLFYSGTHDTVKEKEARLFSQCLLILHIRGRSLQKNYFLRK